MSLSVTVDEFHFSRFELESNPMINWLPCSKHYCMRMIEKSSCERLYVHTQGRRKFWKLENGGGTIINTRFFAKTGFASNWTKSGGGPEAPPPLHFSFFRRSCIPQTSSFVVKLDVRNLFLKMGAMYSSYRKTQCAKIISHGAFSRDFWRAKFKSYLCIKINPDLNVDQRNLYWFLRTDAAKKHF